MKQLLKPVSRYSAEILFSKQISYNRTKFQSLNLSRFTQHNIPKDLIRKPLLIKRKWCTVQCSLF